VFLGKLIAVALGLFLVIAFIRSELKQVHFGEAVAQGGGQLVINGQKLRLWGILMPQVEATCKLDNGHWPCGAYAAAALLVQTRKGRVMCMEQGSAEQVVAPARCYTTRNFVTWKDMGRELVRDGWAMPKLKDSREYLPMAAEAETAGRGLWKSSAASP
jgi:endonuclease YncB( thermonuclease family)